MKTTPYEKYLSLYLEDHFNSFLNFKKDPGLGLAEKELFHTRILLRNKQWREAETRLEKLKTEVPFLKAERYFLLASLHLIQSHYEESVKFGNLAVRYYEDCDEKNGLFKSHYNLSVAFNRIGMDSLSEFFLIQAEKNASNPNHELVVARALACSMSKRLDFEAAMNLIDSIFQKIENNTKFEVEQFKIVAADIYFRGGRINEAKSVVEDVMNAKNTRERGRALFYYHMFSCLETSGKLPLKPKVVESLPEFSLKWDIISNIQGGESERVGELWRELVDQFPRYYAPNFECIDKSEAKAVFNTVLQKVLLKFPTSLVDLTMIKGKKSKKLVESLLNSKTPVRKEVLIEQIWGEGYRPELDARFYKLIERSKNMIGMNIKNSHNAYYLAS